MFTGIVEATGKLFERREGAEDLVIAIVIDADTRDTKIGDSVSLSGACLTVTDIENGKLWFDVSSETLGCTGLGKLVEGDLVNIEFALPASGRYGGHFVTGHVDCLGILNEKELSGKSVKMLFSCSKSFSPYVSNKGSICLDGVSLTINRVVDSKPCLEFEVNVIPHTLDVTTLGRLVVGEEVNIEFDQIARYLERVINWRDRLPQA